MEVARRAVVDGAMGSESPAGAPAAAFVIKKVAAFLRGPAVQRGLSWGSAALLLIVLSAYLMAWLTGNWEMLTDPKLQNSDARTSIFPFHRYAADPNLEDDPIAGEMLALVPWGVHLLYRIFVPLSDVFVAPKLVQAVALAVLVYAAYVLARSKRVGVAAGCVLLFFILHDWFAIYRVAGGLPRAFGFPLFALWLAGAIAKRPWVRRAAPVLCAITYPSVMNLLLAAEGLLALRQLSQVPAKITLRRLKRYLLLVGVCLTCALPSIVGGDDRGPIHTLEQAEQEPAFGKTGRLWILPFADPTEAMGDAFVDTLMPKGKPLSENLGRLYSNDAKMFALVLFGLVALLIVFGLSPPPLLPLSFLIGAVILYAASREFAFRLYSPERYYSFGMRMTALCFLVVTTARCFDYLKGSGRSIGKNLVATAVITLVWGSAGSGVVRLNGMTIDQRRDAELYEFIAELPKDVRFATHPMDGDGIPYYSARSTMGSFETLQPWFTGSWRRQRARTEATLVALYAEDRDTVERYAKQYDVTHFLLNTKRYGRNLKRGTKSFEPFSSFARSLVSGKKGREMYFDHPPKDAIIYQRGPWRVIDVSKL